MDFTGNRRKKKNQIINSASLKEVYTHDLQFYRFPPTGEIQLSEFETLALERLQLLRILEQASQKGHKLYSNDWRESIYNDLNKQNLKKYQRLAKSSGTMNATENDLQARRADHISHFILRLAYCRSDELRKWFVSREMEWFKLRFISSSSKSIEQFFILNDIAYKPISSDEKRALYENLYESTVGVNVIDSAEFYKVLVTEVPSLVKARRVFLKQGYAYIPAIELVTCILGIFRSQLNGDLAVSCDSEI